MDCAEKGGIPVQIEADPVRPERMQEPFKLQGMVFPRAWLEYTQVHAYTK